MQQIGRSRPSGLIIGVLVLLGLAFLVFRGCSPGGMSGIPNTGDRAEQEGRLGRAFAASEMGRDGCPADSATRFDSFDTIYVGFEESEIPQGTSIFARLSREGRPVEDTEEVTADGDLVSCVWFAFEPAQASGGFEPGSYAAELFINGNRADEVSFTVTAGGQGAAPQGGGSDLELGRLSTTTRVDRSGCPTDSVGEFRPDEAVYVAYDRSFIPAGTEIAARLVYEGDLLEETEPIVADRDLDTCFWFVFEPERAGFEPGRYESEIWVNGDLAETIPFDVR
jgi:hypothetical protein